MSREEKQNQQIEEIVSSTEDNRVKIDQIANIRGWFRPEENSYFYAIVQDYLAEKLKLDEACEKIFTPINDMICAKKLDDVNFLDLWYSILHAARRIDYREAYTHTSIVDLVVAFQTYSIPNNEKYNYLYESLSDLLLACREVYNDQPTPRLSFGIENAAWANLNYFLAKLFGQKLADNSLFAIWAMRQAVETCLEDDEESTALQKYETYVPAAAAWVFGAQRALYDKEEDLTPKDENYGNPARGGELWGGKAEFSHARWSFWKERFAAMGKMEGLDGNTQTVARDAVQAMERAETFQKINN